MKIREMIETRQSFVFETTLSSQQSINLMSRAQATGYYVGLYYVALDSVEFNIERVQRRVEKGGHDIPEDIIRRRLDRRNPLHRLFEGRVMEAYDVVRVGETYRLPTAIE